VRRDVNAVLVGRTPLRPRPSRDVGARRRYGTWVGWHCSERPAGV